MKCPQCWAEKAYVRQVKGWKGTLLTCLLLRPMKCNHCYHKFVVSWFSTIGKQIHPLPLRIAPETRSSNLSRAATKRAAARTDANEHVFGPEGNRPRRGDAA